MAATAAADGLPAERFPSKRDGWLVVVLWLASLVDFAVVGWLLLGSEPSRSFLVPLLLVAGVFQLHVLYGIDYSFEGDTLVVRASLFRWRVPLAALDSVEPTRNPLSSPAASLDRLLLRYGKRRIMVSPADRAGFLRALAARAPQLEVSGERARRR